MELVYDARFADPGFAHNQHHLAFASRATSQRFQSVRVSSSRRMNLVSPRAAERWSRLRSGPRGHFIDVDCFAYALDLGGTQRPEVEVALALLSCRLSYCDRAGRRERLHPGCESNRIFGAALRAARPKGVAATDAKFGVIGIVTCAFRAAHRGYLTPFSSQDGPD